MIMKKILFLILVFFNLLLDLGSSSKNTKPSTKETTLNYKITLLEKKIAYLEKRIEIIEKKLAKLIETENEVKLLINSIQLIRGATKEGIKMDIKVENLTETQIDFIFGDIEIINYKNEILYQDKFYLDQIIPAFSSINTVIFIDGSKPGFYKLKNAKNLKINFLPKKIIRR